MLKTIRIFLLGMWEFRSDFTTHFNGDWIEVYDSGRDWAHRLTFRHFDEE